MSAGVLRRARERAGLTQAQLADRAGTSRPTLSAYESGRKSPTLATLERLLAAAGAHLVTEDDIAFAETPIGGGRVAAVPSRLPRLPIERALATVELPLHMSWSGPRHAVALSVREQRARAYELVLTEGTPDDIAALVDGALLADLWDELVLPPGVRAAWDPLVRAARGRAA